MAAGLAIGLVCAPAWSADWNPRLAADYLDQREKQWFEWPPAKASGGPCVSCHTQLPYSLARPLLRKALRETEPTAFEKGIVHGLETRLLTKESMFPSIQREPIKTQARNAEAVIAVLLLPSTTDGAWDRLWSYRQEDSGQSGVWDWFGLDLDPWESRHSAYFGATIVAVAAGNKLQGDRSYPYKEQIEELSSYLKAEYGKQPLHNRLMALWAAAKMPALLGEGQRKDLVDHIWGLQQPDGGWSSAALGPWMKHPAKPVTKGSDAYATALVTFTLQQAGAGCSDPRLDRSRNWLRAHQNPRTGAWSSSSMNKTYPPDSMQAGFMDDAASAFAVLALLDRGACTTHNTTSAAGTHQGY